MGVSFPGTANSGLAALSRGGAGVSILKGSNDVTACGFWMYTGVTSFDAIYGFLDPTAFIAWELLVASGPAHFRLSTNGGTFAVNSDTIVQNVWYFWAFTIRATYARLFWKRAGAPTCKIATVTGVSGHNVSPADTINISQGSSANAQGVGRSFRTWPRILSWAEIERESTSLVAIAEGCVAEWRLQSCVPSSLVGDYLDYSGNGNRLKSIGSTGPKPGPEPQALIVPRGMGASSRLRRLRGGSWFTGDVVPTPPQPVDASGVTANVGALRTLDLSKQLLWELNENLKAVRFRLEGAVKGRSPAS